MWSAAILSALLLLAAASSPTFLSAGPLADRSIRDFVKCSTTDDQRDGVADAFQAARFNAFRLVVDCAVFIDIGMDIAKPIFIDSGTSVKFSGDGRFLIINQFIPAFLIVNSNHIRFTDWRITFTGSQLYRTLNNSLTIFSNIGYYINGGRVVITSPTALSPVSGSFNDITFRQYYAEHRNVTGSNPSWSGPTNSAAMFNFVGETHDVIVTGMQIRAAGVRAVDLILTVFSFNLGWRNDQILHTPVPENSTYLTTPHGIHFDDVELDGTMMGFVGSLSHSTFTNVRSYRYSDLQDVEGNSSTMGGCIPNTTGCWFAPPHLFYFNFPDPATVDVGLYNVNITIRNVMDYGIRVGPGHRILNSGNCLSLKIGAVNSSVHDYITYRPDGVVDMVFVNGLTIDNLIGVYNSSLLENTWPSWRYTMHDYRNIRLTNIHIIDVNDDNSYPPLWGNVDPNNTNIYFQNFRIDSANLVPATFHHDSYVAINVTGQVANSSRLYVSWKSGDEMIVDEHNNIHIKHSNTVQA